MRQRFLNAARLALERLLVNLFDLRARVLRLDSRNSCHSSPRSLKISSYNSSRWSGGRCSVASGNLAIRFLAVVSLALAFLAAGMGRRALASSYRLEARGWEQSSYSSQL